MHLPVISWFVAVVLSLVAARVQSQSTTGGDSVDTTTCSTRQLVEVGLLSSRQLGEVQTTIEMMSHQIESLQQQIQQQRGKFYANLQTKNEVEAISIDSVVITYIVLYAKLC